MEKLDYHTFDVITKPWSNKKQPNENSIYNHILKTVKFLTAAQLQGGALI